MPRDQVYEPNIIEEQAEITIVKNHLTTILLHVLVTILLLSACSVQWVETPGTFGAFTIRLDRTAPELLDKYRTPGAAIALVHDGEVARAQGYGLADEIDGVPVSTETVFQVASISKSITAWGIMRLVEEGRIDLDAPVEKYLTRWKLPASDFDHQGVTVRRLLSHTAGLDIWNYPGVLLGATQPSLVDLLSGAASGEAVRLRWQPGSREKYTNGGYVLLQLLVEDVTGESFPDYIQRQVLEPLEMSRSSYHWLPLTATGYDPSGKPVEPRQYPEAAGGLHSTVTDLATWLAAGMPGPDGEPAGRGVLQPQTLELMYTPVPVTEGNSGGLGYDIEILSDGTHMIWHSGDVLGWRGQYAAFPDSGEGIVVLTNSDAGRYVIADVICSWARWAAGVEPSVCQIYRAIDLAIPAVASLIGLGAIVRLWRLVAQVRTGQRRFSWPPKDGNQSRELILPLVAIALWWSIVAPRIGSSLPPSFDWVSFGFTFWCLATTIKGLVVSVDELRQK